MCGLTEHGLFGSHWQGGARLQQFVTAPWNSARVRSDKKRDVERVPLFLHRMLTEDRCASEIARDVDLKGHRPTFLNTSYMGLSQVQQSIASLCCSIWDKGSLTNEVEEP